MAHEEVVAIEEESSASGTRRTMFMAPRSAVTGFFDFVREHGIVGLAIGFVMGGAVQKVVTALVTDIINPFITTVTGSADKLQEFHIGPFLVGDFLTVFIDFVVLAAVVYIAFKSLSLDKLDKQKG